MRLMLKVLVSNANIEQNSKLCRFLANDKEIKLTSTNDSQVALCKYFETEPDIFILDSFSNNMSYIEVLDRISVSPSEKQKCNTLITLDNPEDKLLLLNTAKVYKIFHKPLDLDYLYSTINLMRSEKTVSELSIEEIYSLLLHLNFSLTAKGTHYFVSAILQCYYYPDAFSSLDNIFRIVGVQHNVEETTVRNAMRSALKRFNTHRSYSFAKSFA